MSQINKLIHIVQDKPVPFLKLRDIVEFKNGKGHEQSISQNGSFVVVNSKFISTDGEITKHSDYQICPVYEDDILMVMSDLPNGRALAKCFIVDSDNKYTLNQRIGCFTNLLKNKINNKFLFYELNRNPQLLRYDNGVDQTNLRKDDILDIKIPIPPLEIQNEIVDILDRFAALNVELNVELEGRKKQYDFYRESIFNSNETREKIALCDLFVTRNGFTPSKANPSFWSDGSLPWFRLEDINNNGRVLYDSIQHITPAALKKSGLFEKDSLIITTSATIGEYALIKVPFLCNQRFTCLTLKKEWKDKFIPEFLVLYFYKLSHFCKNNLNKGNFASVDMTKFYKFEFPVLSVLKQKEIIDALTSFDLYCNDTKAGLPAEIEARQKQFDFYKKQLLSFKEIDTLWTN